MALTKKKKQERIQEFINIILSLGFVEDKWGNYKKEKENKLFRIKIKKINIRFETKMDSISSWFALYNKRIIQLEPDALKKDLVLRGF